MFKNKRLGWTIVCLLLVTILLTVAVQARPTVQVQGQGATASIAATEAGQQEVLKMWTREARLAAKPMPMPAVSPAEPDQADPQSLGKAGFTNGGAAQPSADLKARRQFPEAWQGTGDEQLPDDIAGTPAIYTSYRVNSYAPMWKKYPFYTVGRLYFTTPSGNSYCTASVISPNNIIVTAGHCLWGYGVGWYWNWSFVPADRNGAAPYGSFPWASARVLPNWQNTGATRYDVAVITLGNNQYGVPVTNYVGWLGRSWNWDYVQHHHAFGYPSNIMAGKYTYVCAAESFYGGDDVLGMGCDMTFGSSGGPWIRSFWPYAAVGDWVNSVVSGGTPGTNTFYGARFSDFNIVPLCNDQGC